MAKLTLDLMARCTARSQKATAQAQRAFARLLKIAEQGDSGTYAARRGIHRRQLQRSGASV